MTDIKQVIKGILTEIGAAFFIMALALILSWLALKIF